MVLQLLRELILVGGLWRDHFPVFGVLEDGSVPVVGAHCPEQDAILWCVKEGRLRHTNQSTPPEREKVSTAISRPLLPCQVPIRSLSSKIDSLGMQS